MKLKIKKKETLFEALGANEGMIANDKPTFEEWFIDDQFAFKNVKVSDDSKVYIDNSLKKIDVIPRMEILPEPSVSPILNFRQTCHFLIL